MANKRIPRPHTLRKKTSSLRVIRNMTLTQILATLCLVTLATVCLLQYLISSNSDDDLAALMQAQIKSFEEDIELATKPFSGDGFPLEQIFDKSPIWGTLNSGHYFGLKLSSPESIETSLMWFKNDLNDQGRLNIRHLCDQNDRLKFYSWIRHDFFTFGEQLIEDQEYKLRTTFVKSSQNNLEWQAQVEVELAEGVNSSLVKPLSVIQYILINNVNDKVKLRSSKSLLDKGVDGRNVLNVEGFSKDLGEFTLDIHLNSKSNKFVYGKHFEGIIDKERIPVSLFLHSQMVSVLHKGRRLYTLNGYDASRMHQADQHLNIVAYQMILEAPASFTVQLRQRSHLPTTDYLFEEYNSTLAKKLNDFDTKFFRKYRVVDKSNEVELSRLARVALSNMIGSVGYFYGSSSISTNSNNERVALYGPIQLLTGVPSRSFFPRGFLWDEGFHNLLISSWDAGLSNRIIESWFNIMNVNGWIPREVILGSESERRVPREFIVQRIANANPPAMFIVLEEMFDLSLLQESTLNSIYPKLKAWYNWFNITQSGSRKSTFRWRGRDELSVNMLNPKTLTSGLDDYPRASHPSTKEYHIDLRCWMALAARALKKFAKRQGDKEFMLQISKDANDLADNKLLDELHWSEEHQMYCDFGHNTEKAELVRVSKTRVSQHTNQLETYQVLERHSSGHPTFGCVPEFGYVSLFPMLLNILDPHSDKLGVILNRLSDERELWSPYGVRSLSKSSKFYNKYNTEHDKPYWRGAVWLNINYLLLSSLKSYSKLDGPHRKRCSDLFIELKENLVNNVLKEFSKTSYIWENFDDQTGQGQGSHPFTGWSSLILLIISSSLD